MRTHTYESVYIIEWSIRINICKLSSLTVIIVTVVAKVIQNMMMNPNRLRFFVVVESKKKKMKKIGSKTYTHRGRTLS